MKIFSTRNGDTNRTWEAYGNAKLLKLDHRYFLLCCLNKVDQDLGIFIS